MIGKLSRRAFSQGYLAVGVAVAALPVLAATRHRAQPEGRTMRYEDGLAARFKRGAAGLTTMALAHIGGFSDRIPAWLQSLPEKDRKIEPATLNRIFDALLTGNAASIEAASQDGRYALDIVDPLILLGRSELLPSLHDNDLRRLGANPEFDFTVNAALALAAADEWDPALRILQRAAQTGIGIPIYRAHERLFWKYAYLYGRVDTAMPVLAALPFSPTLGHLVAYRKWQLKTYQIRAGLGGERVPLIEGKQPMGYDEAAAMQVAALADDPAAADYVHALRAAVNPRTMEIFVVDRAKISSTNVPQVFSTAEAQIAAHRKDYKRAASLARMKSQDILVNPPDVIIDALLDERDWRAAAAIAEEHDPRKAPLIEGFADTREREYVTLYQNLAVAAAREGDDAAAAGFLRKAQAVSGHASAADAFPWLNTLLAGVAENRLPRRYLHLLIFMSAFRSA